MDAVVAMRANAPLQWPDAAAVMKQVAAQLADGSIDGIPSLGGIAIDDRGVVSVRQTTGALSRRSADGRALAAGLRDLFRALVGSNPVPGPLQAALESSADGTPIDSVEAFGRAVAFFVRPSADRDLGALAARLRQADEEARLQAEMNALVQHTRGAEPQPPESPQGVERPAPPRPRNRRVLVLTAGALMVLLLGVLGVGLSRSAGGAMGAAPVLRQGKTLLEGARERARAVLGIEKPAPAVAEAPPSPTPPVKRESRGRRTVSRAVRSNVPASPVIQAAAPFSLAALPTFAPEVRLPELGPLVETRVFDARDRDVMPALLVRPHLPSPPPAGMSSSRFGRLEVVVSPNGAVERLRLLRTTPDRRYYDAMLMAAAKAWVFSPARRHGTPVPYRMEVVLTY